MVFIGYFKGLLSKVFTVLFQGHYYHWEAFVNEKEPCALWCRASEDPNIEIRIKPKAVDGLRCSLDSLSVCLDGKCQVSKFLLECL